MLLTKFTTDFRNRLKISGRIKVHLLAKVTQYLNRNLETSLSLTIEDKRNV